VQGEKEWDKGRIERKLEALNRAVGHPIDAY
jgi:hypothetical protein